MDLAYQYIESKPSKKIEMVDGVLLMSPCPNNKHINVMLNIAYIFKNYLDEKKCRIFTDNFDVYLFGYDKNNKKRTYIKPDLTLICKNDKGKFLDNNCGFEGVPSLTIEILSQSTMKNDFNLKKSLYEKAGVKEYWIVDIEHKTILQYLLDSDNKYSIVEDYIFMNDLQLSSLEDNEQEHFINRNKFKVTVLDNLIVELEQVFKNVDEDFSSWFKNDNMEE